MAQLPRIVHLARPVTDDQAAHIVTVTAGLASRRNEPFVVGPLGRRLRAELSGRGVRWVNLPLPESLGFREQRRAARAVGRLLGELGPALVHAHGFQAGLTALLARRGPQPTPPLVCTPHGIPDLHTHGLADRLLRRVGYRHVLRRCDAIIVASEAERKSLAGLLPRAGDAGADRVAVVSPGVERRRRSSVIDMGVKRRRAGLHQDAAVVVLVAPLEPGLPLDDFLHAAALVSEDTANVEFAVIGEGSRMEEMQALAHRLGLSGNAVFLGRRLDALDIVATCNVLAAITDDAGAVVQALEALARDLRVVVNDLPSLREVFGDVEGIAVAPIADHEAFADALRRQLEGVSDEGESVRATTDMNWAVSEVLASQDEFDLDKPGLDPHDRSQSVASDVDRLLEAHTVDKMVARLLEVYSRLLDE